MIGLSRDDVIRMAREAGISKPWDQEPVKWETLERFAALVAAAEREKVAQWMMQRGYATGHGNTIEDLLAELDWQIAENWNRAMINGMKTEREACAKVAAWILKMPKNDVSAAIRARGQE
jgi:hypothetical protein